MLVPRDSGRQARRPPPPQEAMGWLFGETVKKDANYHGCRYVWTKLHQKESDLVKLKKVFDAADRSGDGEVDIHEFLMYDRGVS